MSNTSSTGKDGLKTFKMGVMFRLANRHKAAVSLFQSAIAEGMHEAKCHYNLAASLVEIGESAGAIENYTQAVALDDNLVEAKTDLAALLIQRAAVSSLGAENHCAADLDQAVALCESALRFADDLNPPAWFNLNTALRQQGRQAKALQRSWRCVEELTRGALVQPTAEEVASGLPCLVAVVAAGGGHRGSLEERPKVEEAAPLGKEGGGGDDELVFACVKWGPKYDAGYVNRLAKGIWRHHPCSLSSSSSSSSPSSDFEATPSTGGSATPTAAPATAAADSGSQHCRVVCFTDDPTGLDERVEWAPLPTAGKATPPPPTLPPLVAPAVGAEAGAAEAGAVALPALPPPALPPPTPSPPPPVPQPLTGWWHKAYLFSPEAASVFGVGTRVLYIDLDSVVLGCLNDLAETFDHQQVHTKSGEVSGVYNGGGGVGGVSEGEPTRGEVEEEEEEEGYEGAEGGGGGGGGSRNGTSKRESQFRTLSTESMVNENGRRFGLNSSVMSWRAGAFERLWTDFQAHSHAIRQVTYKFDAWLEMMLLQPIRKGGRGGDNDNDDDDDGGGVESSNGGSGRQRWSCGAVVRLQEVLPGQVREYCEVRNGLRAASTPAASKVPPEEECEAELSSENQPSSQQQSTHLPSADTRLVTFPLRPKPHEVEDEWVKNAWVL